MFSIRRHHMTLGKLLGEWLGIIFFVWLLLTLLSGCATVGPKFYTRQPLFEQRLAPRPGFTGLTNQVCMEKEKEAPHRCVKMDVLEYDMTSPTVRTQLRDLKFVCNVAGRRFRIAENRPGLTENACIKSGWFGCKVLEREYIDFPRQYQKLLDAKTFCAAQDSTLGRTMFLQR